MAVAEEKTGRSDLVEGEGKRGAGGGAVDARWLGGYSGGDARLGEVSLAIGSRWENAEEERRKRR